MCRKNNNHVDEGLEVEYEKVSSYYHDKRRMVELFIASL